MSAYNIELHCSCNGLIGAESREDASLHERVIDYWHAQFNKHIREHATKGERASGWIRIETPTGDTTIDAVVTHVRKA